MHPLAFLILAWTTDETGTSTDWSSLPTPLQLSFTLQSDASVLLIADFSSVQTDASAGLRILIDESPPPPPPPPSTPASFSLRSDADAADQEFPLLGAIVGGALGGGVTIGATIVALVMVCKKAPTAQAAPPEVAAVPVVTAVEMRTVEGVRV